MKHLTLYITLGLTLISCSIYGQKTAITQDGKKVILAEDGTWKYDEPKELSTETDSDVLTPKENDNCKYSVNEIDEFSGERTIKTEPVIVGKTTNGRKVYAQLMNSKGFKIIKLSGYGIDLGCTTSNTTIDIKLVNGDVINLVNHADTECGGDLSVYSFFSPLKENDLSSITELKDSQEDVLQKLMRSPIEKIKISGTKYYTVIDIDDIHRSYLLINLACIW